MIAIKIKDATHQIISCNTYFRDGKHQLWVERPNGKAMKIVESESREEVELVKEAIDFAIQHRDPILELN